MLAQSSDFICKSDFYRMKSIGKIFRHLGHSDAGFECSARCLFVEFTQRGEMRRVLSPEDGVRRLQEVSDGASFSHELGIVSNRKIDSGTASARLLKNWQDNRLGGSG